MKEKHVGEASMDDDDAAMDGEFNLSLIAARDGALPSKELVADDYDREVAATDFIGIFWADGGLLFTEVILSM